MKVVRDVQTSFMEGMERPIGRILPSVFEGSNAALLEAVAPLYLTGSVLDVTYGDGKWWDRFKPGLFTAHDLYKLDGVDFRALPEGDASVDTVCFDPPYVESGGRSKSSRKDFLDSYGISNEYVPFGNIGKLMVDGLTDVCRVAREFVLVKCMEFVAGAKFHDMPVTVTNRAAELGWRKHDVIVHNSGGGIGGGYRTYEVLRASRAHSYLLVFTPARRGLVPVPVQGKNDSNVAANENQADEQAIGANRPSGA